MPLPFPIGRFTTVTNWRIFGARFYHLCCGTAEQSLWEREESLAESGWFWAVLGLAFTLASVAETGR